MKELTLTTDFNVPATPERVFPLLCPVLEYKWLAPWRCELLHSQSGVAEEDCVFRTGMADNNPMTWVISHYEPSTRIEFSCFVPDSHIMRPKIALALTPDGVRLTWTHRFLATSPAGEAWLGQEVAADQENRMGFIQRALIHYLETGTMLRP